MQVPIPYCLSCVHYRPDEGDDDRPGCAAFPGGIPGRILERSIDHREPYPGDGGLRFERRPGVPLIRPDEFGEPYAETR